MLQLTLFDAAGLTINQFYDPADLTFSTKLPGGCDHLSATLAGTWTDRSDEYDLTRIRTCQLTDESGVVLWAGRMAGLTLDAKGETLEVAFDGDAYSLWDDVYGKPGTGYASPVYVADVLLDIITGGSAHLSQDTSLIQTTNTVDLAGTDNLKFTALDRPGDIATRLLGVPDANLNQWWWTVWYDRRLAYFPRSTAITHTVQLNDLADARFSLAWDDVWSGVIVSYTDLTGTDTISEPYHDTATARRLTYPRTFPLVLTGRGNYDADAVTKIADLFLREHDRPKQRTDGFTVKSPFVGDAGRTPTPTHLIRAGDVVRITDLLDGNAETNDLDGRRTFNIVQTEYSARDRTLRLTPDYAPLTSIDALIARLTRAVQAPSDLTQ